jgi:hypothetical protein
MESYKRVALSLMLLLSTPLTTFCMEGIDGEITQQGASTADNTLDDLLVAGSNHGTNGSTATSITPIGSDHGVSLADDLDDNVDIKSSPCYSARSSIEYTGLEDFDKRSCDNIAEDAAYKALIKALEEANVTPRPTPPSSPSLISVRNGSFVGATAAVLYSIAKNSSPVLSSVRRRMTDDSSKGLLPILATQTAMDIVSNNAGPLFVAAMLAVLFGEMKTTASLETENKTLSRKVQTQDDYVRRLLSTLKRHEKIEHGLIGTEHDLLVKLHKHAADIAVAIAKSKATCATCRSTQASLNKKIVMPLVSAMADLNEIHLNADKLLTDTKEYSALDPRGWFHALKDLCHKHAKADTDPDTSATDSTK